MLGTVTSQNGGLASISVGKQQIDTVSGLATGNKVTVLLRQEDIIISLLSMKNAPSSARNNLAAKIIKIFLQGSQIRVTVDCGFPLVALITRRSYEELGLGIGHEVIVSFKASSVHLIHRR